jgi:hypothetical protein
MSEAVPSKGSSAPKLSVPGWIQRALLVFGILSVAAVMLLALLPLFIDGEGFREPLQRTLAAATRREVALGKVEVRTFGGIGLRTDQLRVVRPDGTLEVEARSVFLELDLLALLTRQLSVRTVELDGAQFVVNRDAQGRWNFADIDLRTLTTPAAGVDLSEAGLRLLESTVSVRDDGVQPGQSFQVTGLSLNLRRNADTLPLTLQATILNSIGKRLAILTVDGELTPPPPGGDWNQLGGTVRVIAEKFRPRFLGAYTRGNAALKGLAGVYDLDFIWKGRLDSESRLEGSLGTRLLNWTWPEVFGKDPWVTRGLRFEGALALKGGGVVAEPLRVIGEGFDARIDGSYQETAGPGAVPLVDLAVNTGFVDPYLARKNLPVGILPVGVRPWVVDSQGSGRVRTEAILRGPLDRPKVEGLFEFDNFRIANPRALRAPIEGLNGKLLVGDQRFELQGLRVGRPGFELTATGTIGRATDPPLNLKLLGDNAELTVFTNVVGERLGTLSGRGKVDLALTGTLGVPQVLGRVDLLDATLRRPNWPQPLTQMRGALIFEPQKLTLADLSFGLGASLANVNGVIDGLGTAKQNPQLAITSSGLDLKLALPVLASDLPDANLRAALGRTFRSLGGTAALDLKLQGSALSGKVELRGAVLGLAALGAPLADTTGILQLGEQGVVFEQLRTLAAGSPVTLKGSVAPDGTLQVSGNGTFQFPQATALLPAVPRAQIHASGSVNGGFDLGGSLETPRLSGLFDLTNLSEFEVGAFRLAPARRLSLAATLGSQSLRISEARLELEDLTLLVDGSFAQPYDLRLRSEEPVPLPVLFGHVKPLVDLGASGTGSTPVDFTVVGSPANPGLRGSLVLSGVSLPGLLGIADLGGTVDFEGSRARASGLTFRTAGGANARLSGALSNYVSPVLDFDLRLDRFDFDALVAAVATGQETQLRGLRGGGRLHVDAGTLSRLGFTDLDARVRLDRGILGLADLAAMTGVGRLNGQIDANLRQAIPQYSGNVVWRSDAGALAGHFLDLANQISGESEVQISFSAAGSTPEAFLASLGGSGSLTVTGGRLATADLLGPAVGASLQGPIRSLNTGRFERVTGNFRLERGTLSTDAMTCTATAVSFTLNGTLSLTDRQASLRAEGEFLRPSPALLSQLQRSLGGAPGTRTFAFEVEGPITQASSLRNFRLVEPLVPLEPQGASTPVGGSSAP